MNVYSELLELLCPRQAPSQAVHFGTISGISPLRITVGGREVGQGLFYPRGTVFCQEHIGREVALLPCAGGFLILFQVEGGEA